MLPVHAFPQNLSRLSLRLLAGSRACGSAGSARRTANQDLPRKDDLLRSACAKQLRGPAPGRPPLQGPARHQWASACWARVKPCAIGEAPLSAWWRTAPSSRWWWLTWISSTFWQRRVAAHAPGPAHAFPGGLGLGLDSVAAPVRLRRFPPRGSHARHQIAMVSRATCWAPSRARWSWVTREAPLCASSSRPRVSATQVFAPWSFDKWLRALDAVFASFGHPRQRGAWHCQELCASSLSA